MLSRKTIWKMTEKLIPATEERLEKAMQTQKSLYNLLNTPIKYLPKKYWNIYDSFEDEIVDHEEETLQEIILKDMKSFSRDHVLFSETKDGEIVGYASYNVPRMGDRVTGIFIISFDLESPRRTMAEDFISLLQELVVKYKSVEFNTNEDSFADRLYMKVLRRLNIPYDRDIDEGIAYYTIYNERFYENIIFKKRMRLENRLKEKDLI